MWKKNFMFREGEASPLEMTENDLYNDTEPAVDSAGFAGLKMEKFISVWIQGDGEDDAPIAFTNVYVRTASLDLQKRVGFWQPLQGRSHEIKQMLTVGQKEFVKDWLRGTSDPAWEESEDHFKGLFQNE